MASPRRIGAVPHPSAQPQRHDRVREPVARRHRAPTDTYSAFGSEDAPLDFSRTQVPLRLLTDNGLTLDSRAQARWVVSRLELFATAELDFDGVDDVGPASSTRCSTSMRSRIRKSRCSRPRPTSASGSCSRARSTERGPPCRRRPAGHRRAGRSPFAAPHEGGWPEPRVSPRIRPPHSQRIARRTHDPVPAPRPVRGEPAAAGHRRRRGHAARAARLRHRRTPRGRHRELEPDARRVAQRGRSRRHRAAVRREAFHRRDGSTPVFEAGTGQPNTVEIIHIVAASASATTRP